MHISLTARQPSMSSFTPTGKSQELSLWPQIPGAMWENVSDKKQ